MNKLTQMEIALGIRAIRDHIDRTSSKIVIRDAPQLKSAIFTTVDFFRKVDSKAIHSFEGVEAWFTLTADISRLEAAFDSYADAVNRGILEGKTKEFKCSKEEAKPLIAIILALCCYNLYSGYSYDYSANSLIAFT